MTNVVKKVPSASDSDDSLVAKFKSPIGAKHLIGTNYRSVYRRIFIIKNLIRTYFQNHPA